MQELRQAPPQLSLQELSLRAQELSPRAQELSPRVQELNLRVHELSLRMQERSLRVQQLRVLAQAVPLALAAAAHTGLLRQMQVMLHLEPRLAHGPCRLLAASMERGTLHT
jgi:hypothetical protein